MTWKSKVTTLDGRRPARSSSPDAIFGLEPRTDLIQRCVRWQLAKRRAGTHKVKNRAEIWRTGKKMYAQKGTGRPATARPASSCSAAAAARSGRCVRSHEHGLPKKVRALALQARAVGQGQGRRHHRDRHANARRTPRPRRWPRSSRSSASTNALIIDGAEIDAELPQRRAQHPEHRRAADPGHQRLRHPAARQAGADQGRGRCAGGALQMSTTDPRHYDVICRRSSPKRRRRRPSTTRSCSRSRATPPSRRSRKRWRSCSTSRSSASTR